MMFVQKLQWDTETDGWHAAGGVVNIELATHIDVRATIRPTARDAGERHWVAEATYADGCQRILEYGPSEAETLAMLARILRESGVPFWPPVTPREQQMIATPPGAN